MMMTVRDVRGWREHDSNEKMVGKMFVDGMLAKTEETKWKTLFDEISNLRVNWCCSKVVHFLMQ